MARVKVTFPDSMGRVSMYGEPIQRDEEGMLFVETEEEYAQHAVANFGGVIAEPPAPVEPTEPPAPVEPEVQPEPTAQ